MTTRSSMKVLRNRACREGQPQPFPPQHWIEDAATFEAAIAEGVTEAFAGWADRVIGTTKAEATIAPAARACLSMRNHSVWW
ncbi:hypothetical protein Misp02_37500 [Microtetraspora sp. NBRC 16547]|nr:hypothetical protein Misp02_37500 [Microtetraspora sp. NBRC 16547]